MRALLIGAAFLLSIGGTADATTYTYAGQPLNNDYYWYPGCLICTLPGISGSVTFGFDTSHFTGSYGLKAGDDASFTALETVYTFPGATVYDNFGELLYGQELSGTFDFVDGQIAAWQLSGFWYQNCLGPGCHLGFGSSQSGDAASEVYPIGGSNDVGGVWTMQQVAAVPELPTWALLLIGFAVTSSLVSARNNRRRSLNLADMG